MAILFIDCSTGVLSTMACYHQPREQTTNIWCQSGTGRSRRRFEMNCVIPLSSSNTAKQFARFMILLHVVLAATLCAAQEGQQLTERRTLGFVGPVRSVLTAIE